MQLPPRPYPSADSPPLPRRKPLDCGRRKPLHERAPEYARPRAGPAAAQILAAGAAWTRARCSCCGGRLLARAQDGCQGLGGGDGKGRVLSSVNASILYMELILEYFTEDIRPVASSPPSFVSAPASSFSPAPSCPALHGHAHVPSIKLVLQSELFSHPVSATETARVLLSKDPGRQAGRRLRLQVHVHSLCDLTATANR